MGGEYIAAPMGSSSLFEVAPRISPRAVNRHAAAVEGGGNRALARRLARVSSEARSGRGVTPEGALRLALAGTGVLQRGTIRYDSPDLTCYADGSGDTQTDALADAWAACNSCMCTPVQNSRFDCGQTDDGPWSCEVPCGCQANIV